MRTLLVHNPGSGRQRFTQEDLLGLLSHAGYNPEYASTKEKGYRDLLKESFDLVFVAGGDGTISKVAFSLAGKETPIVVLPAGTANNICRTLGSKDSIPEIIEGLHEARTVTLDLGQTRGPWGTRPFLEGVGAGVFASTMPIQEIRRDELGMEEPDEQQEIHNDLIALQRRMESFGALELTLDLDGKPFSGRYLLVEALNTGFVGPHIPVAPHADPGDGKLEVVLVPEDQRAAFMAYLNSRIDGDTPDPGFSALQGDRLRVTLADPEHTWRDFAVHIDGAVWPKVNGDEPDDGEKDELPDTFEVSLERHALQFLVSD